MMNNVSNQVRFGNVSLTKEDINQKLNLSKRGEMSEMSSVAAAPMAARPFADDDSGKEKSHTGLYATVGTLAVLGVIAGFGHYKKLPEFAQKHYTKAEDWVVKTSKDFGGWVKKTWNNIFNKEKSAKAAESTESNVAVPAADAAGGASSASGKSSESIGAKVGRQVDNAVDRLKDAGNAAVSDVKDAVDDAKEVITGARQKLVEVLTKKDK